MKTVLIYLFCISLVFSLAPEDKDFTEFEAYKKSFGKKYASQAENDKKFSVYKTNKRATIVEEHMSKKYSIIQGLQLRKKDEQNDQKKLKPEYQKMEFTCYPDSAKYALNVFADMTEDEFIAKYSNINEEKIKKIKETATPLEIKKNDIPKEVDWRKKGEIKDKDITKAKKIYVLKSDNEEDLKAAVAEKGPITISLPGQHFRFLKGGIVDYWLTTICKEDQNMLMTIVGYDNQCGIDYWIVKAPFGEQWGEKGYFHLRRGINTCQITHFMTFIE